ncbi:MAG: FAD-dependent oxidoreductase [Cereibacter sphaeroides]|uniref:FAD-dependent oxidoreductase n=1 Tax=Cereibacter sphaeroides TaxID=1063 RepID=A0A2W5SND4_CERSP|nr:MAG: FAD-dependent oxidoreductase [Cereibacter sphaeroides]
MSVTTVAILGAGPVGLAAAAHLLERGMVPLVLEQGKKVAGAVRDWGHVPMFSDWQFNVDAAAIRRLRAVGWTMPKASAYPNGEELVTQYLDPLAASLDPWLRLGRRVVAVSREGMDKVKDAGRATSAFVIETEGDAGPEFHRTDAVIDTTGTWSQPNPGGAGRPVAGEVGHPRISYGMPAVAGRQRQRFEGCRVAVLGGGYSAVGNLIALAALEGTDPIWLCRASDPSRSLGGGAADQLAARGAIGVQISRLLVAGRISIERDFRLAVLEGQDPLTIRASDGRRVEVDELIISTGFRPDLSIFRELRVSLDPALECPPALAPLIDPNLHSCGTVRPHGAAELAHPEPGFYIAGMKSYGRAPTFLLATGYEQVRSIVAAIAGDHAAAARVELVLPETGVCNGPGLRSADIASVEASGCCGGPARNQASACCAADEAAKGSGKEGCGCGSAPDQERQRVSCC